MVIKPASQTPFSALALCELAERAGIPKGVVSVITGSSGPIGHELTTHPLVRKLALLETITGNDADRAAFEDRLHVLFDQALLAEGGSLTDPAAYVQRVNRLLA